MSKDLIRCSLHSVFKMRFSEAISDHRICQEFRDRVVNVRTAKHWFPKFRPGELSLYDLTLSGRSQALDDEAMRAAIEKDSNITCSEFGRQFYTSDDAVRFNLHRLSSMYRLSKWIPLVLLWVYNRERVAASVSLLSHHRTTSITHRALTSDENCILYNTPKRSTYWLSDQDAVPHNTSLSLHTRKIMLCDW